MRKTSRHLAIGALLAGVLLAGLGGCGEAGARKPPKPDLNVLLISMDTTRADHLACYGHPNIKTPNIDRLASAGVLFEQCTAAVPVTLPSHASIMTGTYPFVHMVRDNGSFRLHADNLTLAEVLRDAGYATAAQVAAFVLDHQFGLDQGFAIYRDVGLSEPEAPGRQAANEIKAEQVTDGAIGLLRQLDGKRFFLFVHYFDPHGPYTPPERFAKQYPNAYTAEIAYTDEQIGRLLAALTKAGHAGDTLIVLVGDHGEGLGRHDETTHGNFLYDTTLAVPLIFWCPKRVPAGGRVAAQVRTVDVPATILSLLGLPPLPDGQGADLSPLIRSKTSDLDLAAYAETFYPRYNFGYSQLRSLRDGRWKYIHAPVPELYDLSSDPGEQHNVAAQQPQVVADMRNRLRDLIERAPQVVRPGQAWSPAGSDDIARLTALGYLGGGPDAASTEAQDELDILDPEGPNPMDHAREIEHATRVTRLIGTGRLDEAEVAIRELLAASGERSEHFVWAHAHLADVLLRQGKLEEALEQFKLAARGRPGDGQTLAMEAVVLEALGRKEEALAALREAVTLEPVFATTHAKLGALLAETRQINEAIQQFRLAIEKDPLKVGAYMKVARLLAEEDQLGEAVTVLDHALKIVGTIGDGDAVKELQTLREQYRNRLGSDATP